jgi:hypothetical protein
VRVSHGVDALDPALPVFIQGLGSIDARLVHDDAAYCALSSDVRATFEESVRLTDRVALSQLWVLGAYEAIRTIDERVRTGPDVFTKRLAERVTATKQAFARLRMPLAKLQAARAHATTDFSVAHPAIHRQLGVSWRVAMRVVIPRRRLADRLLALLDAIQRHKDHKTG